jgi:hypothetical protein
MWQWLASRARMSPDASPSWSRSMMTTIADIEHGERHRLGTSGSVRCSSSITDQRRGAVM